MIWVWQYAWDAGSAAGQHAGATGQWWVGVLDILGLFTIMGLLVAGTIWASRQDER